MQCQINDILIPKCPHLKPFDSSQDFQDINLQDDFFLSQEKIELARTTSIQSQNIEQEDQEEQETCQTGKRTFNQTCSSRKYTFQSCIEKVQKRPQKRIHR